MTFLLESETFNHFAVVLKKQKDDMFVRIGTVPNLYTNTTIHAQKCTFIRPHRPLWRHLCDLLVTDWQETNQKVEYVTTVIFTAAWCPFHPDASCSGGPGRITGRGTCHCLTV